MKRAAHCDPAPAAGGSADRAATSEPPPAARTVFGARLDLAERYAAMLATDAVVQGHIGPREVPRIWERHLLNSAVLTDLLPLGARVVDVGSGAGLPGLPMAIRRPDLQVDLLEPMLRRTRFLTNAVGDLGLTGSVRVVRGRAEESSVVRELGGVNWVVTRAVAPLDRLVRWCLPLLASGGHLLALKGATAARELEHHRTAVRRLGGEALGVQALGQALLVEPTWVLSVRRGGVSASRQERGTR